MTDLSLKHHPVFATPPVGAPYVLGLWHPDRFTTKGYRLEARIYLKSLVRRSNPKKFIIFGRPRSGTTLLVRLLDQVNGVTCQGEILHNVVLDPVGFVDRHARTRAQSVVGAKIITYQMFEVQRLPDHRRFLEQLAQRGFQFIHARRNTYRQSLSLSVAQARNRYHMKAGKKTSVQEITLDPDVFVRQIRWNLDMLDYEERLLESFQPFVVQYEQMLADHQNHQPTIDAICAWLEWPASPASADLTRTARSTIVTNEEQLIARLNEAGLSAALTDG